MCFCNTLNFSFLALRSGDHTLPTYTCFPALLHAVHGELSKADHTAIRPLDPLALCVFLKHLVSGGAPAPALPLRLRRRCCARPAEETCRLMKSCHGRTSGRVTATACPACDWTGWPCETPQSHVSSNTQSRPLLPGALLQNEHTDFVCRQRNHVRHTD